VTRRALAAINRREYAPICSVSGTSRQKFPKRPSAVPMRTLGKPETGIAGFGDRCLADSFRYGGTAHHIRPGGMPRATSGQRLCQRRPKPLAAPVIKATRSFIPGTL
jgi:hypothetical protein